MKTRSLWLSATCLLFGLALSGCEKKPTDEIKIGAILPLTGSSASAAEYARQGIQLALKDLNDSAPSAAPRLVLELGDSKNAAKDGLAVFSKMESLDGIRFFIATNSGVVVPLAQHIGKREDVLLITTFSSAPGIPQLGQSIFRLFVTAENEAATMSRYLGSKGVKRAAIFYINDEFGLGGLKRFGEQFPKTGGQVVWSDSWEKGGSDFRSSLQRMPKDVEALYIVGYEAGLGLSVKQAREIGYGGLICTTVGMSLPPWRAAAAEAAEGVIYTNAGFTPDSTHPATRDFVVRFKAMHGVAPNAFAAFAYDAAMAVGRSIQSVAAKGEVPTPAAVSKQMLSSPALDGALGTVQFDSVGEADLPLAIWTFKDGKESPVK